MVRNIKMLLKLKNQKMRKTKAKSLEALNIHTGILEKQKENTGITLVALVVTIVVLLILAAVSISLVLGQNGLIANAKDAREKSKNATENENYLVNGAIPSYIAEQVNGTTAGTSITVEELENAMSAYYETSIYKKIENDLNTYTSNYKEFTYDQRMKYVDEFYEDTESGWFASKEEYDELKKKMLKSVYQNGGFWVARYEAGRELSRDSEYDREGSGDAYSYNSNVETVPLSKPNLAPYTDITRTQAKKIAEMVQYTNNETIYKGSLLFGVQWDLVLAFMHNKGNISNDVLISDSKNVGNYHSNDWNITNTSVKFHSNYTGGYYPCPLKKRAIVLVYCCQQELMNHLK